MDTNHIDDKQIKIIKKSKKNIIIKKLIQNLPDKKVNEEPKNILQSLLKDIDKNTKKVIVKNIEENKKIEVEKHIQKGKISDNKISDNKISDNKIISKQIKETPHIVQKSEKQTNNLLNNPKEITKPIKKENIKEKILKKEKMPENKIVMTGVKQGKIETVKKMPEKILDKINTKKQIKTQSANSTYTLATDDKTDIKNTKEIKDKKIEPELHKQEFKNMTKVDTFKADKNVETKNSINHFSNDLKEKMESYKPPIMKVKMALNPKSLGGVEVTLIHRGNNLHVNITSNANTMSLFTQNQAEFKNSLVNMGFTNLEMNFSDQNQNKQDQRNQKNKQNSNHSFEDASNQKSYDSTVELIIPQYI